MNEPNRLSGVTVLVTRPQGQGEQLCARIRALNGNALHIPAVEVHHLPMDFELRRIVQELAAYDGVLFVSANAVEHAMPWLTAERAALPPNSLIGAVGKQTAQALDKQGIRVTVFPAKRHDSEGLLAVSALQNVRGKNILIVRGRGGRTLLGDELRNRGARVDYAEVYERRCPAGTLREKIPRGTHVDIVVATSNEMIDNLLTLAGTQDREWLCTLPLIVFSERNREHARAQGFIQSAYLASTMSDEGIVEALMAWSRAGGARTEHG